VRNLNDCAADVALQHALVESELAHDQCPDTLLDGVCSQVREHSIFVCVDVMRFDAILPLVAG